MLGILIKAAIWWLIRKCKYFFTYMVFFSWMNHLSLAHSLKVWFHKVLKHKCDFKHMTSGTVSKIAPVCMPLSLQILKDLVESAASAKLANLHCSESHLVFYFVLFVCLLKCRSSKQENQWEKSIIQLQVNRGHSDNSKIYRTVILWLLVDNYTQK